MPKEHHPNLGSESMAIQETPQSGASMSGMPAKMDKDDDSSSGEGLASSPTAENAHSQTKDELNNDSGNEDIESESTRARKTSQKRALQNRAAQKAFRQRKEAHLKRLESEAIASQARIAELERACYRLPLLETYEAKAKDLEALVQRHYIERELWISEKRAYEEQIFGLKTRLLELERGVPSTQPVTRQQEHQPGSKSPVAEPSPTGEIAGSPSTLPMSPRDLPAQTLSSAPASSVIVPSISASASSSVSDESSALNSRRATPPSLAASISPGRTMPPPIGTSDLPRLQHEYEQPPLQHPHQQQWAQAQGREGYWGYPPPPGGLGTYYPPPYPSSVPSSSSPAAYAPPPLPPPTGPYGKPVFSGPSAGYYHPHYHRHSPAHPHQSHHLAHQQGQGYLPQSRDSRPEAAPPPDHHRPRLRHT